MRLLIATDGSPNSHIVQDEVIARPWPTGTQVLLLRCVYSATYPLPSSLLTVAWKNAREELDESVAALNKHVGLRVSAQVADGHPAKAIVTEAEVWDADFIFLGSRGVGPVERFLLGSTVTATLHHAPCAVEIVRHPWRDPTSHPYGARRILMATDGSPCSEKAVESVATRPWPAGTEFRIISVPLFATPQIETGYLDVDAWAEIRQEAVDEANRAVEAALARLKRSGLAVDAVVPSGLEGPKASILDEADRWQADLIVAGSHGRGRLDRFLLGSISESLALYAPCSVEVFREKQVRLWMHERTTEASYIPIPRAANGGV